MKNIDYEHIILRREFIMLEHSNKNYVYVGTYTDQGSEGIYGFELDSETGQLKPMGLLAKADNPSYLAIDQDKHQLYAVLETQEYGNQPGGSVQAYKLDRKIGTLHLQGEQPVKGKAPCHLSIDRNNQVLITANYLDGSLSVFPIKNDGSIGEMTDYIKHEGSGPNSERQEAAHAHYVTFSPEESYIYAVDLGMDEIKVYRLDSEKKHLLELKDKVWKAKAGTGPRHIAFHPNKQLLYVVKELCPEITLMSISSDGSLQELQTVKTIPEVYQGENLCAAIKLSSDGKYLYVTNRGHNSIATYSVQEETGRLTLLSHTSTGGNWPRDLEVDPSGRWILVANQESNEITVFEMDRIEGRLIPVGNPIPISRPVCIKIME